MKAPTRYHWIITLSWHEPSGGVVSQTGDGMIEKANGSRSALYGKIMAYARAQMHVPQKSDCSVLFFSLEPDGLPRGDPVTGWSLWRHLGLPHWRRRGRE